MQVLAGNRRAPLVSYSGSVVRRPGIRWPHSRIQDTTCWIIAATASSGRPSETDQPEKGEGGEEEQQIEPTSSTSTAAADSPLSAEEIQRQMGELRRAKQEQVASQDATDDSLVSGVLEEVQLIEWPTFTSALLNTLLVISIVFGTSVVLFGVNTALTEVSNAIYK